MADRSQKSLRKARSEGRDPAHGGVAAAKRGETMRLQNQAYSSSGDRRLRQLAEDMMRNAVWVFEKRQPRASEAIVESLVNYVETVEAV